MSRFFRILVCSVGLLLAAPTPPLDAQNSDPLVQVLVSKGVLTPAEAGALAGTPVEQRDQLAKLLAEKGVITPAEYSSMQSFTATLKPATAKAVAPQVETQLNEAPPKPSEPTTIPAVAPMRALQAGPPKKDGLIPDIKLGTGARLKLYGFLKMSSAYDTSSPYGNDFPLPGFCGPATNISAFDIGPNLSPEFHEKVRASRVGAWFEWPDAAHDITVTGRVETDFEGNFTRASNRNLSSIRSSQLSMRLAWGRIDYKPTANTGYFLLAGQDWSPFGSSILSNTIETTGLDIGFGGLWEREPQLRFGVSHDFGGSRHFTVVPEVAVTLPASSDVPASNQTILCPTTPAAGKTDLACIPQTGSVADQLAYGERQGPDSAIPGFEPRLVFQWQADKQKGVPPAQFVISGMWGRRRAIVTTTDFSDVNFPTNSAITAASLLASFPRGTTASTDRWGYAVGFSIPTRWATLSAQYYRGTDLRWYFAGQVYNTYINDLASLHVPGAATVTVPSIDSASTVQFALNPATGKLQVVPELPLRAQGGFVELGIPLSRYFKAEPAGRMAGWTMNLHYGYDGVFARDVRRVAPAGGRGIGDLGFVNLNYKMNQWVTFAVEESYFRTRAIAGPTGELPTESGLPAHQWHDVRSELATIFSF